MPSWTGSVVSDGHVYNVTYCFSHIGPTPPDVVEMYIIKKDGVEVDGDTLPSDEQLHVLSMLENIFK